MSIVGSVISQESSRVSIVIPTKGPLSEVIPLVRSFKYFLGEKDLVEVVIVLNGEFRNVEIENAFKELAAYDKVRVVLEPVASLLAGRHRGVTETVGEVIAFLDDDVSVCSSWWSSMRTALFDHPEIVLFGGPSQPIFESTPPSWISTFEKKPFLNGTYNTTLSLIDLGDDEITPISPLYVWGLNFVIRRSALVQAGGFNPDLLPSEDQMFQGDGETGLARKLESLGLLAGYFPGISVLHRIADSRTTLDFLATRGFYDGVSEAYSLLRPSTKNFLFFFRLLLRTIERNTVGLMPQVTLARTPLFLYRKCYSEGFFFLFRHYLLHSRVRDWIKKPNYWDFDHSRYRGKK